MTIAHGSHVAMDSLASHVRWHLAIAMLFVVVSLALWVPPARAANLFPAGTSGFDVSWIDCNGALPVPPYAFALVSATGGFAFTHNACLSKEYAWAAASGRSPALYVNMKFPAGTTANEGLSGPSGNCAPTDSVCQAQNYGYKTAQDAMQYAASQGVNPSSWWLDVETASTWSPVTSLNVEVIHAASDYFRTQGATVGIYSTPAQWQTIAGNYNPGLSVWLAGATNAATAADECSTTGFGGGTVQLVQFPFGQYDADIACPATRTAVATPTAMAAPTILSGAIPARGFGLVIFSGGTVQQLLTASGCSATTAAFYYTVAGNFVVYVPGTSVTTVNTPFLTAFAGGVLPPTTPLLARCAPT